MSEEVCVLMPLALSPRMITAVREDPTTKAENWEDWHAKLGWLICAYDVMLEARRDEIRLSRGVTE